MAKAPAIGIDLGTTYSCVAVFKDGKVHIIPNDHNNRVTPSFVAFTENERLIGEAAKSQVTKNPENTVWDSKRLIGRNFHEKSVQEDLNHLPFKVVNSNGKAMIEIKYKNKKRQFPPEEISSMVLSKMKSVAEAYIGQPVTNAVITVPAYFNDEQRQATKDAGQIAGLNVMRIINEPTAAAIAYGLNKYIQKEVNILVFDLGGGTFDVSILKIDDGVFEVKSTCGNTHLGGEDFDTRLLNYCVGEFKQKYGKTLDNKAVRRLRNECEQARRTLSSAKMADIYAASLCEQIDYRCVLTREKFEQLCQDLFQATLKPVEQALADAKIDKSQIDEVVLVGGSTRIPKIQQMLQEFFNGKNLNKSINPDEAVAYGAAVQAAILNGDKSKILQELLLIDVAPLSLGIQTSDGKMDPLIKSNTSIPTKETKQFSTSVNGQKELIICVLEGDRLMAKDNNKLDEFWLRGITAMPRGIPKINVTFTINENGILNVCAEEIGNANKAELTITNKNSRRLSKDDIMRMKKDAEKYREEDEKQRIRLEALSGLDSYLYKVNRSINNAATKSKIPSKDLSSVVRKAKEIQDWFDKNQNADKKQFDQKFIELHNAYEAAVPKASRFK